MVVMLNLIFLLVGIVGLCTTSVLAYLDKSTLSQRAQALCPRWLDWIIGVGGVGILCFIQSYICLNIWLFGYWCCFWGHIWIANRERYKNGSEND